jgi:hypothetical protein
MEDVRLWDLLTASLAVCELEAPEEAWRFLVHQGLVRDAPGDIDAFVKFVRIEIDRGPYTGPTVAARVSSLLTTAGIASQAGSIPDPRGKMAQERFERFRRGSDVTSTPLGPK